MRRAALLAIALTAACTGCGARGLVRASPVDPSPRESATTTSAARMTDRQFPATPSGDVRSPVPPSRPTDHPSGFRYPSGPAEGNTMPLHVTLERRCGRPGDVMRATATTRRGAKLAFTAYYYEDNSYTPDLTYVPGEANATGTFTWTWTLRPDVPIGDGVVQVVAAERGDGASFNAPFRVARAC